MLVGQILDEKYRIERELGRGGMGSVYLAMHVGTERAVAVKVIAPEFMRRSEFIERFRREARAAGRLRHPNVVDVTDFGIAQTNAGNVAYLVMEYLDGCTLGEILEEEKNLPLSWTLDILEQTCAAVDEAHRQGIIHRDLKPDNIWLEPNARGGYTVKVLDFGIAKLEEPLHQDDEGVEDVQGQKSKIPSFLSTAVPSQNHSENQTLAMASNIESEDQTLAISAGSNDENYEDGTLNPEIRNPKSEVRNPDESGTAIFPHARTTSVANGGMPGDENLTTKILTDESSRQTTSANDLSSETAALTRIGAVLGTPLYMSPEQCRGEKLDSRADVYALGVIAYQMLSGKTPFSGKYTEVMEAHKATVPPPLDAKKVGRKVKRVVAAAIAKNPDERPATAVAFASRLRSGSEGIGSLLRRALVIYSEHLPTFLGLSLLLSLPLFILTLGGIAVRLLNFGDFISPLFTASLSFSISLAAFFAGIFFGSTLIGVTTWIVAQTLAAPLRPIAWRPALLVVRKKWRVFAGTVTVTTLLMFLGYALCLIPGIIFSVRFHLVAPIVMMENLSGRAALKRSTQLVKRSFGTVVAAVFLQFFVPMIVAVCIGFFVSALLKSNEIFVAKSGSGSFNITVKDDEDKTIIQKTDDSNGKQDEAAGNAPTAAARGSNATKPVEGESAGAVKPEKKRGLIPMLSEVLFQIVWFPTLVIISSFTSIITALLYLKTRQAGGESMQDLLAQFAETERAQKRWQLRLKGKLAQSGRHTTSRST